MDHEKLIVVLLLVAVILSVFSILITSTINVDEIKNATPSSALTEDNQAASVSLTVEPNPNFGGTG